MPKIREHAENKHEGEERCRTSFFKILCKTMEVLGFSSNARQCNIAYRVVHVQLCL